MLRNVVTMFIFTLLAAVATAQIQGCTGWETGLNTYKEYFAKWKAPSCYSFTFQSYGVHPGPAVKRDVKPGALRQGPYRKFQTMDDFWKFIKAKCYDSCPNGRYSCSISYATHKKTGISYPSFIVIGNEDDENDTISYGITNFRPKGKTNK